MAAKKLMKRLKTVFFGEHVHLAVKGFKRHAFNININIFG